jgi:hypothetical protein
VDIMRATWISAALVVVIALLSIVLISARADDRVATWPPPAGAVQRGGDLHFRGGRGGPVSRQFDGFSQGMLGAYRVGDGRLSHVTVTRRENDWVCLEEKGQWEGSGVTTDSSYYGVFVYGSGASDTRNRGARGTHVGTIDSAGVVHVRGTFENRAWPAFEITWTPVAPRAGGADTNGRGSISRERLREIPVDELFVHPVWPPPNGGNSDPRLLYPATPPAKAKARK